MTTQEMLKKLQENLGSKFSADNGDEAITVQMYYRVSHGNHYYGEVIYNKGRELAHMGFQMPRNRFQDFADSIMKRYPDSFWM